MPRPDITSWSGLLFRRQLRAALDWLEAAIGTGGGAGESVIISGGDLGVAHGAGDVILFGGLL